MRILIAFCSDFREQADKRRFGRRSLRLSEIREWKTIPRRVDGGYSVIQTAKTVNNVNAL